MHRCWNRVPISESRFNNNSRQSTSNWTPIWRLQDSDFQTPFFFLSDKCQLTAGSDEKNTAQPSPGIEPGSSDCRSDALTTELRSHDRNCVRIFFVFHQAVSSFSLRGDPHVRACKHFCRIEKERSLIRMVPTGTNFRFEQLYLNLASFRWSLRVCRLKHAGHLVVKKN